MNIAIASFAQVSCVMDFPSVTDEELLLRFVQAGDRQALDALFRRHLDSAYRVAVRIVRKGSDAEDVVQAAFIQVIGKSHQYRTGGSVKSWMLGIVVNTALDHIRSATRRRRHEEASGSFINLGPDDDGDREDMHTTVREAVEQLPEQERLPIFLRFLEGLSFAEVASALHIPESTARVQVHRGIVHLRERLHGFGRPIGAAIIVSALTTTASEGASPALAASVAHIAHTAPVAVSLGGLAGITTAAKVKTIVGIMAAVAAIAGGTALLGQRHGAFSALAGDASLSAGLVAHWTCDEVSGATMADSTAHGNVGTLVNGASWASAGTMHGLSFDGANDYAIISNSPSLNAIKDRMSIALWVFRRSKQGLEVIIGRRMGPEAGDLWGLCYFYDKYGFGLVTADNGGAGAAARFDDSDLKAWVHLAGVYDGKYVSLYRNGALQARGTYAGIIPDEASPVIMGAGDNGSLGVSEFSDIIVDDVRIYNRALSAQELQALATDR